MKYILMTLCLMFSGLSWAGESDGYQVSESVKWNGPGPHPAKRQDSVKLSEVFGVFQVSYTRS